MRPILVYFPSGDVVRAELVTAPDEILRGLMYRTNVPDGTGMLFDQGETSVHRIWMKNCLVPLDLIFIGTDRVIVGIVPDAAPGDLTERGVERESRYVLEVPGGWCAKNRVDVGQRVTIVMPPQ